MNPNQLIEQAALVSRMAHKAARQKRKYTNEPYWHHPAAVASTVGSVPGATAEMIAAAYLHDVVEDTGITHLDISQTFGANVCSLVFQLTDAYTDTSLGNREHRKALERDRMEDISPEAQTIKYADLIDNTGSIVEHDPGFAVVYLKEKERLLDVMDKGDHDLYQECYQVLQNAKRTLEEFLKEKREHTYKVHINGRYKNTVFSEKDAWALIGKQTFGSGYEVYDAADCIRPEFIPY